MIVIERRNPPKPKPSRAKKILTWLIRGLLFLLLMSWLPVLALRWWNPPMTVFMWYQDRQTLNQVWTDYPGLYQMSRAVMAAEDQKFLQHHGFDLESIQDAVADNRAGKRVRGASTITQQTAKNLFLWPGKNWVRKGLEAYFTVLIELTWSKQRILEVYLNVIEFAPKTYGISGASKRFFDKSPAQLSLDEAALLATVLPNPKRIRISQPSDYALNRQAWIIQQVNKMQYAGFFDDL